MTEPADAANELLIEETQNHALRRCMACGSGIEPPTRIHRSPAGYPYCEDHLAAMPTYSVAVGSSAEHECSRCEPFALLGAY